VNKLDPATLFGRIAADVPSELHQHLFVTGSLAAAYEFQAQLEGRAVNTKDADLIVHPAGNVQSCREMAETLLNGNWTRTEECYPSAAPQPEHDLRAIRLYPPNSHDYFIEFLNLPGIGQQEAKRWIPIELPDGWYGLPSFRFMGLTALYRIKSAVGLEYAAPSMMALSNLLSHPKVGDGRIESGTMQGVLRSAKDLGRVLALARLAGRDETEKWIEPWAAALRDRFPNEWKELAAHAGDGLRELLDDDAALEEARQTTEVGLLNGMGVTLAMLKATGERLFLDVIEPLSQQAGF
jgi:hypothetical protein